MATRMSIDEYQRQVAEEPDDSRKHDALYQANERIGQLERLNATLAAEIDRMRPVVEAAVTWNKTNYRDLKECELALDAIGNACDTYEVILNDSERVEVSLR